jgi:hypothetical protein
MATARAGIITRARIKKLDIRSHLDLNFLAERLGNFGHACRRKQIMNQSPKRRWDFHFGGSWHFAHV